MVGIGSTVPLRSADSWSEPPKTLRVDSMSRSYTLSKRPSEPRTIVSPFSNSALNTYHRDQLVLFSTVCSWPESLTEVQWQPKEAVVSNVVFPKHKTNMCKSLIPPINSVHVTSIPSKEIMSFFGRECYSSI